MKIDVTEKKMFGGICFLFQGKMAVGVVKDDLMARVVGEKFEEALEHPHAREMDFTGKALKEFVYVDMGGVVSDADLEKWMQLGLEHARGKAGLR